MSRESRAQWSLHWLRDALPSEHGFWVMLGGALGSALLRTHGGAIPLLVAASTALLVVGAASIFHRRIRRSGLAQLAATLMLSFAAVPVELAGRIAIPSVVLVEIARAIVFVSSSLVVRAAFARNTRSGATRNWFLHLLSVAIAVSGALAFYAVDHPQEAVACAMAAAVCAVFAYQRPTVKQLKLLGLALSGLVLASAVALAF